jgi:hypothetical protein
MDESQPIHEGRGHYWPHACAATVLAGLFVVACAAALSPWIGTRAATNVGSMLLFLCGAALAICLFGWLSARSRELAFSTVTLVLLGAIAGGLLVCGLVRARSLARREAGFDRLRSWEIHRVIDRPRPNQPPSSPAPGSSHP